MKKIKLPGKTESVVDSRFFVISAIASISTLKICDHSLLRASNKTTFYNNL